MAVILDEIKQAGGDYHLINGWVVTRLATVTGLSPASGGQTTAGLWIEALTVLISITGNVGSPCPDLPTDNYLERFVLESITGNIAKIRIIYRGFPLAQIEFGTTLSQVQTNKDASGHVITTAYKYKLDYVQNIARAGTTQPQGALMTRPLPELSVTYSNLLIKAGGSFGSASEHVAYYTALEGYVNNAPYTVATVAGAARTWMVTSVRASSPNAGLWYIMSITFQYRLLGWDDTIYFINPDDGLPPKDIDSGVNAGVASKKVYVIYEVTFPTISI